MYRLFCTMLCLMLLPACWENRRDVPIAQHAMPSSIHLDKVLNNMTGSDRLHELVASGNVIVDFYAPWCPPCKMMLPIIDQIANEYPDIKVVKVDVDLFEDIANKFQVGDDTITIGTVPQFYFFKDGKTIEHFKGTKEKDAIKEMIKNIFNL